MIIEPFRPEHVLLLGDIVSESLGTVEQVLAMAKINAHGPGWTGFTPTGECIGACGVRPMWRGTGEAWGIFSPLIASHALSAVRAIRKGLDMLIDAQNLQRVQATVNASHPRALAFARSLGFREEGLMLKYHDGFDYWMVSKT